VRGPRAAHPFLPQRALVMAQLAIMSLFFFFFLCVFLFIFFPIWLFFFPFLVLFRLWNFFRFWSFFRFEIYLNWNLFRYWNLLRISLNSLSTSATLSPQQNMYVSSVHPILFSSFMMSCFLCALFFREMYCLCPGAGRLLQITLQAHLGKSQSMLIFWFFLLR
jgi:hypothetical protein